MRLKTIGDPHRLRTNHYYIIPPDWIYPPGLPFSIAQSGNVFAPANGWDISSLAPVGAGKAYYVDPVNGLDTNDGSELHPRRGANTTALLSDIDLMYLMPGFYYRSRSWQAANATRSIAVRPWPGKPGQVILTNFQDGLTWALQTGSTYKATRSNTGGVVDMTWLDSDGDYKFLTTQTSIANVDANPGSWYTDGTTIYVRTFDSRAPDTNIGPLVGANVQGTGNITLYFENIWFYGTQVSSGGCIRMVASSAGQTPRLYAKNCKFKYSPGNGLTSLGVYESILQNCEASKNLADGFNYHANAGNIPHAIEIACKGFKNGTLDLNSNDNGSSIHDGGAILRMMGEYYGNIGPNVIDILASLSLNLGVISHDSAADVSVLSQAFEIDDAGGKMWLNGATAYGCTHDLMAGTGAILYKHNTTYGSQSGSGIIMDY